MKVLDIAAGHGAFGIAIGQRNPKAQIVAVDWPNVLQVARENAASAGLQDRHHSLPGDAFRVDYGSGYHVALVTNFIHHFDEQTNVTLLRKIAAALVPGGKIAILEFVPNEDRVTPHIPSHLQPDDAGDHRAWRRLYLQADPEDAGVSGFP